MAVQQQQQQQRTPSVTPRKQVSKKVTAYDKFVQTNFAKHRHVDYSYEQLQGREVRRQQVLEQGEMPLWRILLTYDGTVVQILMYDIVFWLTVAIYVTVMVLANYGVLDNVQALPSDSITVLGGFVSFFMVFWVNQSHSRFFGLYEDSMGCKGAIFNTAQLAVTNLPRAQAKRLIRYMNGAHAAGYLGISDVYECDNYFEHIERTMRLLTKQERARLDAIDLDKGGSCTREMIAWSMNEVHVALKKEIISDMIAKDFRDNILALQKSIGALYNAKDLPIPYFYVHFICLLTTLYLPLFAVTAAIQAGTGENAHWSTGLIRGLTVVLQAVFVIGLRVLGQKMNDPYGDDLIDLSVMYYIHFTWQMSNRILNSHFPDEANALVEDDLTREREDIGKAWDDQSNVHDIVDPNTPQRDETMDVATETNTEDAHTDNDLEDRVSFADRWAILNPL